MNAKIGERAIEFVGRRLVYDNRTVQSLSYHFGLLDGIDRLAIRKPTRGVRANFKKKNDRRVKLHKEDENFRQYPLEV